MAKKLDMKELVDTEFMISSDENPELRKAAKSMKEYYDALVDVGFSEDQAMILLILLIKQINRK